MKTLIVGANGQLGQELQHTRPPDIELFTADREALNICDQGAVLDHVAALMPAVIINCAAYTAVDGAETKPDLAVEVNAEGPGYLARAAERVGARLLHVSTDFVFDGAGETPYEPRSEPRPLGVYGHSKLAGERRVQEILPLDSVILRTAWLYSAHGTNFVKTMLRLMGERDELGVVDDQVGAPTWARGLAGALWAFTELPDAHGIYHWTDGGSCSWYEFACAIYAEGRSLGLLENEVHINPIPGSEYPTPAQRPAYSVLDCRTTEEVLGQERHAWRAQLTAMLKEVETS